jgi:hypothetical protein
MYNFTTMLDTVQNAKKDIVAKLPMGNELKDSLTNTIDTQTVVTKTYYVEAEKTLKLMANLFFSGFNVAKAK